MVFVSYLYPFFAVFFRSEVLRSGFNGTRTPQYDSSYLPRLNRMGHFIGPAGQAGFTRSFFQLPDEAEKDPSAIGGFNTVVLYNHSSLLDPLTLENGFCFNLVVEAIRFTLFHQETE